MRACIMVIAVLLTAGCDTLPQTKSTKTQIENVADAVVETAKYTPPSGSNQMLRSPLTLAEGLEVIVSDVVIPPNGTVPRHYHPGEEFVYVIEGSAVHAEEGKPDQVLKAGDTYVIPPRVEHAPRAGEEGARAIVFRVHVKGEEERVLVED